MSPSRLQRTKTASHCNQNTSSTLGSITGIWVGLTRTRTSLMSSWPKIYHFILKRCVPQNCWLFVLAKREPINSNSKNKKKINKKQMNKRLTSVSSRFTPWKTHFHLHIRTSSPRGLASLPSPVLAAVVPLTRQLPPWIRLHPTSEFPSWNGNPPDIDIPRSGSDFQRVASSNNDDSFAFWCNNWKVKRTFSEGGLLEEDAFVVMKCCCLELSKAF